MSDHVSVPNTLELMSTEVLLQEVAKRFHQCVFVASTHRTEEPGYGVFSTTNSIQEAVDLFADAIRTQIRFMDNDPDVRDMTD